jgi:hypothetical protein
MARKKPEEKKFIIYALRCIPTGAVYIGQSTRGARYRQTVHRSYRGAIARIVAESGITTYAELRQLLGRRVSCPHLTQAIIDHPSNDSWEFSVLHELSNDLDYRSARQQLTALEIEEIKARNTLYPSGLNVNLGFSCNDELREANRVMQTGRPKPPEQRERMSQSQRERWARRKAEGLGWLNNPVDHS